MPSFSGRWRYIDMPADSSPPRAILSVENQLADVLEADRRLVQRDVELLAIASMRCVVATERARPPGMLRSRFRYTASRARIVFGGDEAIAVVDDAEAVGVAVRGQAQVEFLLGRRPCAARRDSSRCTPARIRRSRGRDSCGWSSPRCPPRAGSSRGSRARCRTASRWRCAARTCGWRRRRPSDRSSVR